ncbi:MAG: S1 RNA-binding domain-containing protein [Bacteroidales bacterium]|jgi:hypothetical protein|nr:S1 RNA-binding domain-containing protein [Bacteroidales bacterium]
MKNLTNQKIEFGRVNTLKVIRLVDFGVYLDGGESGDILMPKRYVPDGIREGDSVDVFVYIDSEDRPVATTEKPYAMAGEFAFLAVKSVSRFGAFLDWGVAKDLLVPYSEQLTRMEEGKSYVVYIYYDARSKRMVATERYGSFLDNLLPKYEKGEAVQVLVSQRTPLGYRAIINNKHTGMIYASEVGSKLRIGQQLKAYILKVRDDDKIDLTLTPLGYDKVGDLKQVIIRRLQENGGRMRVGDKTDPETIKFAFGCSKKAFKMTIGTLYKQGIINIDNDGITLLQ